MKKFITTIALVLLATTACASDVWSLQLHGLSWHAAPRAEFDQTHRDWNERNVGLGIRHTFSATWGVQAGAYRNSVDRTTVYAVANYTPVQFGALRVGGFAGLGSGYKSTPLLAGGLIEIGPVTVRVIPRIKGQTPMTFGLEVGIPF